MVGASFGRGLPGVASAQQHCAKSITACRSQGAARRSEGYSCPGCCRDIQRKRPHPALLSLSSGDELRATVESQIHVSLIFSLYFDRSIKSTKWNHGHACMIKNPELIEPVHRAELCKTSLCAPLLGPSHILGRAAKAGALGSFRCRQSRQCLSARSSSPISTLAKTQMLAFQQVRQR